MLGKFRFFSCKKNMKRQLGKNEITIEQLDNFIRRGAIVIDVRSPQEFREGHIDNALCIPDYEIMYKIRNIIPNKQQEIVLYCSSGNRSGRVQKKLNEIGYSQVYNLYNGYPNY